LKDLKNSNDATKCVHSGLRDNPEGAVVTPIYQTSTFKFDNADQGAELFSGKKEGYIYTRMRNPTVEAMENAVACLELGHKALGCSTGMAAIHTLFAATLVAGDHIICSQAVYGPTATLLTGIFANFGVESTFVDTSDLSAVELAVKSNTKMIYVETPGNPTLVISDIVEISEIAKKYNLKVAVDNTFMSPVLQKPFKLGADYIVHSMTKFINGHADVVAGAVVVNCEEDYLRFRKVLNHTGGTIDPFNAFLVHRGIKTLNVRIKQHCINAQIIAEYLEAHPKVEWVRFPGLKSHPQYDIAQKQMTGAGAVITFELKGGLNAGKILMDNVEVATLAVSLGGVESLIEHPASMTHAGLGPEALAKANITTGLVRLSVGIEDVDEIIGGLNKGLDLI